MGKSNCVCFFFCRVYLITGPGSTVGSESDCISSVSSIPVWSHTFLEIDHEINSTVILLLPLIQVQAKYVHKVTGYPLSQACPGKSVSW